MNDNDNVLQAAAKEYRGAALDAVAASFVDGGVSADTAERIAPAFVARLANHGFALEPLAQS